MEICDFSYHHGALPIICEDGSNCFVFSRVCIPGVFFDIHRLLQDSLYGKRRVELHSRIFHLPYSSNDDSHLLSV